MQLHHKYVHAYIAVSVWPLNLHDMYDVWGVSTSCLRIVHIRSEVTLDRSGTKVHDASRSIDLMTLVVTRFDATKLILH